MMGMVRAPILRRCRVHRGLVCHGWCRHRDSFSLLLSPLPSQPPLLLMLLLMLLIMMMLMRMLLIAMLLLMLMSSPLLPLLVLLLLLPPHLFPLPLLVPPVLLPPALCRHFLDELAGTAAWLVVAAAMKTSARRPDRCRP